MTRNENAAGRAPRRRQRRFEGAKRGTQYNTRRDRLAILDRLDGLRQTGPEKWIARCPAHDDRSPSLSIRDAGDRLLIHDHAGCSPADVLAAVGLELADLFDEPINIGPLPHRDRIRIDYRATLRAIRFDLIKLALVLSEVAKADRITDEQHDQLAEIIAHLMTASEAAA